MKIRSKKYRENKKKVDFEKKYDYKEALQILLGMARSKFDETIDIAIRLGIDPKQTDQQVRGAVVMPHGIGKSVRVLVFAKGEKVKEADDAGADLIGDNDLIDKIQGGWLEFDKIIATPDMMGAVSKLGKVLGPKGLMPNPKLGTVTFEVANAVKNEKKGKVEFKIDKTANVHSILGKASFGYDKLVDNFKTFIDAIVKQKPSSSKGTFLRSVSLSSSQSPSILINTLKLQSVNSEMES